MDNEIVVIVKLKKGCNCVKYFEESYNDRDKFDSDNRYYNFTEKNSEEFLDEIFSTNNQCCIIALIYEGNSCMEEEIIQAYIGLGEFTRTQMGRSLKLFMKVKSDYNSSIKNIVKLAKLDFSYDFKDFAYVSIEKSKIITDQINFIISKPSVNISKTYTYAKIDSENNLHRLAQRNQYCRRMYNFREPAPYRGEFQRDYERIIHSRSFRRMVDKAQIFSSVKGDYYRTRMTHSQAVDQIARGIAIGLKLNTNLTEAIALGHDLGHTPFGHQGERTLDDILRGKYDIIANLEEYSDNHFGGFKHNYQSLRVASFLEEEYFEINGMDLSYQTLEGMLKHTKLKREEYDLAQFISGQNVSKELRFDSDVCSTLEGQVVAIADEIAQRGHDLDDALSSGSIKYDELKSYFSLKKMEKANKIIEEIDKISRTSSRVAFDAIELKNTRIVSLILSFFINDVIDNSQVLIDEYDEDKFERDDYSVKKTLIKFSDEAEKINSYLETIISSKVINNSEVSLFDRNAAVMVRGLFKAYYNNPKLLHKTTLRRLYANLRESSANVIDFEFGNNKVINDEFEKMTKTDLSTFEKDQEKEEYKAKRWILVRTICDYISGMTDTYAINEYNKLSKEI